jgi:hypothetical protein
LQLWVKHESQTNGWNWSARDIQNLFILMSPKVLTITIETTNEIQVCNKYHLGYQISDTGVQFVIQCKQYFCFFSESFAIHVSLKCLALTRLEALHLNKCKKLTDAAFKNLNCMLLISLYNSLCLCCEFRYIVLIDHIMTVLTNLRTLSMGATSITNVTVISKILRNYILS